MFCSVPDRATAATFQDALGREILLSEPPRRIISLAPHLTEILFAVGAGPQVVGVTTFCDFPAEAQRVRKVGSFSDPSPELVLAAKPDLVLATVVGNRREAVERLIALGLPVFVTHVATVVEVPRQIRLIGQLVGQERVADGVAQETEGRLAEIARRVAGRPAVRVYYQIWEQPIITVSEGSFMDDAIRFAGGLNVFSGLGQTYPRVSREAVLAQRPDVMILSGMGGEGRRLREPWLPFRGIPAVAADRLHVMYSDLLHRPGPRIVEGIEQLARWFHPQAFLETRGTVAR